MPLNSLKILDFSSLLPGPYATRLLSDLGADVLRVESPTKPELNRLAPPLDEEGVSFNHRYLNRGKRSIALDLKQDEAIEIVKRLVQEYDVLVEGFRPGVMDRLGLGYQALKAINPRLIYCSITGFGQDGPYASRPGHDINYLALSGSASYTGRPEQGPLPLGVQVADLAGGSLHGVVGILAAVIERSQSGLGQQIDISMTDAAFALNAMAGADALGGGVEPRPGRLMLNGGSFYDYYQTSDGRYFSVGSVEPHFAKALFEVIGQPELAAVSLSPKPKDQLALKSALKAFFEQKSFAELSELFKELDICVEPVLSVSEAAEHPQLQHRQMVVEVATPSGETQKQLGLPIKFSRFEPKYGQVSCLPGTHNQEVLRELGYDEKAIEALKQSQVAGG